MSQPTPIKTATTALATAINSLKKIQVINSIDGQIVKVGPEERTDFAQLKDELGFLQSQATDLANSLSYLAGQIPLELKNAIQTSDDETKPAASSNGLVAFSSTVKA